MSFWQRLGLWFKNPFTYRERQRQWANRFDFDPARPRNPLPLDPGRDPWRT